MYIILGTTSSLREIAPREKNLLLIFWIKLEQFVKQLNRRSVNTNDVIYIPLITIVIVFQIYKIKKFARQSKIVFQIYKIKKFAQQSKKLTIKRNSSVHPV